MVDKFETELTKAYATIDNRARRVVFDDEQKLRELQKMVAADFLQDHKAVVDAEIARIPMTMNFATALSIYRNAATAKYPQGARVTTTRRGVNETNRGRGNGVGRGRGGGRRGTNRQDRRQNENTRRRNHPDQEPIILRNRNKIMYHPSYKFTPHEMERMYPSQRERLQTERARWRESRGLQPRGRNHERGNDAVTLSEIRSQIATLSSRIGMNEAPDVPDHVGDQTSQSQISQISSQTGGSIMGGRSSRRRQS